MAKAQSFEEFCKEKGIALPDLWTLQWTVGFAESDLARAKRNLRVAKAALADQQRLRVELLMQYRAEVVMGDDNESAES